MVYVVKGVKVGMEVIAVCETKELAKINALDMLDQGYNVLIISTPLIKG